MAKTMPLSAMDLANHVISELNHFGLRGDEACSEQLQALTKKRATSTINSIVISIPATPP
jgi:hypothetical protein